LLRQRSYSSRSGSSLGDAWQDPAESGSEEGREAAWRLPVNRDEGEQAFQNDSMEAAEDFRGSRDREREISSEAGQDLLELQAIEVAIAAKQNELRGIFAHQATLSKRLEDVEQNVRETRKEVHQLTAAIEEKESESEALQPHRTPRRGVAETSAGGLAAESSSSRPVDLENLVGTWSQARTAMGLLDD
jgi:hypothetical protein